MTKRKLIVAFHNFVKLVQALHMLTLGARFVRLYQKMTYQYINVYLSLD